MARKVNCCNCGAECSHSGETNSSYCHNYVKAKVKVAKKINKFNIQDSIILNTPILKRAVKEARSGDIMVELTERAKRLMSRFDRKEEEFTLQEYNEEVEELKEICNDIRLETLDEVENRIPKMEEPAGFIDIYEMKKFTAREEALLEVRQIILELRGETK